MKGSKGTAVLTVAEKCKSILASNREGKLTTIKVDAEGSKGDVHSLKVKCIVKKGKPYVWVPENDSHNVNTVIDERGSLAVTSPFPGPLARILNSMKRSPSRIALTGDFVPLKDEKVSEYIQNRFLATKTRITSSSTKLPTKKLELLLLPFLSEVFAGFYLFSGFSELSIGCLVQLALKSLEEAILSEHEAISESTYVVSGLISSANLKVTSHSENLKELLDGSQNYSIYKFDIRSCTFVDCVGHTREIDLVNIQASKTDPLARYAAMLIDGINQSESRRRALVLFCLAYLSARPRDAYMLSIDRNGFDVLGRVPNSRLHDASSSEQFLWKEFRLPFPEEACDIEKFCHLLVNIEENTIKKVSSYSGIGV